MRAIAILMVVLFHADVPGLSGGYVGVDVFFVISGFVITGLLLREYESTGRTSIRSFYGRRTRRILPAATLVIVATVLGAYVVINSVTGRQTAVDGQWASVFLANFHFAASGSNYLASQSPPSLLQNFWSLAVEEQFYIVYPTVFLIAARLFSRSSVRVRVGLLLGAVVIGSYVLSVVLTAADPSSAFFSPFTRAWELALGGLVAVASSSLLRLPKSIAAAATWLGCGGILVAAFTFTSATSYPGSLAAIPVVGTALVIAGGAAQPTWGVESVLRLRSFQMLGLVSYSLYLWHWPILMIAAQARGSATLPVEDNLLLLLLSLVAAVGTYILIENPVRHSSLLMSRKWSSIIVGLCLIASSLAFTTFAVDNTQPALTGSLASASTGSTCPLPSKRRIARLRLQNNLEQQKSQDNSSRRHLRMLVIGDSTACSMLLGLSLVSPSYGVQIESGSVIGCGVVSDTLAPYYYNNRNFVAYTSTCQRRAVRAETGAQIHGKPDVVLWGSTDEANSIVDPPDGSSVLAIGTPAWKRIMSQRIEARVAQFVRTGARVVLLLEPPRAYNPHQSRLEAEAAKIEKMNELLKQEAARHPRQVAVVDLASRVCPSGPPCPFVVDGVGKGMLASAAVRPDDLHYGRAGSIWVAKWLVPQILAAIRHLQ
jgi:peptidoglycan/LPS O-acetylase OafA/YrhL